MDLWQVPIAEGPVPVTAFALAVVLLAILAVRRWRVRPLVWALAGAAIGAVVGYAAYKIVNATNVFGDAVPTFVWHWCAAAFAAIGFALGGMVGARTWRRVLAGIGVVVFAVAACFAFYFILVNPIIPIGATIPTFFVAFFGYILAMKLFPVKK